MRAHAQVYRRAQRLLPAGIDTVALLPAAPLSQWEGSPLSALPLAREGRRGVIGLRLHARTAQALRVDAVFCRRRGSSRRRHRTHVCAATGLGSA